MATYGFRDIYRVGRLTTGPGWIVLEWDGLAMGGMPAWHPIPGFPPFATINEAKQAERGCYRAMMLAIDHEQWVVRHRTNSTRNEPLFWSNDTGWGDRDSATVFLGRERNQRNARKWLNLPIDGEWSLVEHTSPGETP